MHASRHDPFACRQGAREKDKRLVELEKKMSAYDDSFYALEVTGVTD